MYEKWFGRVLRAWRKKRDFTQQELALKSGLTRNLVGDLERGQRTVGREELFALCRTLNINPSAFVSEVDVGLLEELRALEDHPRAKVSEGPEEAPRLDPSEEFEKDLDSFLAHLRKIVLHFHGASSQRSPEPPAPSSPKRARKSQPSSAAKRRSSVS